MKKMYLGKSVQHKFDSYCKKVLRNEAMNIRKQINRVRRKEISFNTEIDYTHLLIDQVEVELYDVCGIEIPVSNEKLVGAIDGLADLERKIILLYYFAGFNDKEISRIINMSTSGVWYKRKKTISDLNKEWEYEK